jgi:hypothetical protein
MSHIEPVRLFDLSQAEAEKDGFQLDDEEKQHIRECEECQEVLRILAHEFTKHRPPHDKPEDAA